MANTPTHYDRLGVARNAPEEVIRGAYKALAQKNHPDKNLGNPGATNIMQEINQAYDVLSDPAKRADYDARLGQQEMHEAAKAEKRAHRSAQQAAHAGSPMPTYAAHSRGNPISLVVILLAAGFVAFFIYFSISPETVSPLLPNRSALSVPEVPAKSPQAADTFVAHETTPHELAVCIFAAAKTYSVPSALLLGLLSAEGGTVGGNTPVADHSYDLGLMQLNSFWIPELAKAWDVSNEMALRRVRDDACTNVGIGAWILQMALAQTAPDKSGDLRGQISSYYALAHHAEVKMGNEAYVEKVMKMMVLYRPIHGPDDLLGQAAPPISK